MSEVYHVPQDQLTKTCSQCHEKKPLSAFHKDRCQQTGYKPACQNCRKAKRPKKARKVTQLSLIYDENVDRRICSKCEKEKLLCDFVKQNSIPTGYKIICKKCDNERRKRNYEENREREVIYRRDHYNAEEKRAYNQKYHSEHRDSMRAYFHAYYETNKEKSKPARQAWQNANSLKCRESNNRRRAHKKRTAISKVSYKHILERDGYNCYICGGTVSPEQISYDHVIPLARRGTHSEANIKICHKICNCRKHTSLLEEMTPYQRRGIFN